MLNAKGLGLLNEAVKLDNIKNDILLKYGLDHRWLWLVVVDFVDKDTGVIYITESGSQYAVNSFKRDDMESFEMACKAVAESFKDVEY